MQCKNICSFASITTLQESGLIKWKQVEAYEWQSALAQYACNYVFVLGETVKVFSVYLYAFFLDFNRKSSSC